MYDCYSLKVYSVFFDIVAPFSIIGVCFLLSKIKSKLFVVLFIYFLRLLLVTSHRQISNYLWSFEFIKPILRMKFGLGHLNKNFVLVSMICISCTQTWDVSYIFGRLYHVAIGVNCMIDSGEVKTRSV
jgi:hypothetical protein